MGNVINLSNNATGGNAIPITDNSASGFVDIGGMRIQWGRFTSNVDTEQTVNFPAAFADATYSVVTSIDEDFTAGGPITVGIRIASLTTTSFGSNRNDNINGTPLIYWQAIGLKP